MRSIRRQICGLAPGLPADISGGEKLRAPCNSIALDAKVLKLPFCAGGGSVTRSLAFVPGLALQFLASQASAASAYPLTARLSFAHEARVKCQAATPDEGFNVPIERLRAAFESVVQRMFRPADHEPADVGIEIAGGCAEVMHDVGGRRVVIRVQARVDSEGRDLDVLSLDGEEHLLPGVGQQGVERATDSAIEQLAASLEPAFANSKPVVAWLIARHVRPVGSTELWPPRGGSSSFADLASGLLTGGGEEDTISVLAHLGVANRWFLLQGVIGAWGPSFMAAPSDSGTSDIRLPTSLRTVDLGLEAGPVLRFGPAFEVRGGAGAHLLFGGADVSPKQGSSSFTHYSPTLFAALQMSRFPSAAGRRFRFGIEVRKYFQTTVGLPELSRTIRVADLSIAAYVGLEWPLGGGSQ